MTKKKLRICPKCGSIILRKLGHKQLKNRTVQRYQCDEGHVFYDKA